MVERGNHMDEILQGVIEQEVAETAPIIETVETTESVNGEAAPSTEEKPFKTEENAHFAEMRRKNEASEARATKAESNYNIAKTYGADYGVYSDEDIAAKFGHLSILNAEQLKAAIEKQDQETALREKGIDPNALKHEVDEHPEVKEARESKQRNKVYAEFEAWYATNKGSAPDINTLPQPVIDAFLKGESMKIAFMEQDYSAFTESQKVAKEAAAVQKANEKNAIASTGSAKSAVAIGDFIPKEMFEQHKHDSKWMQKNYDSLTRSMTKWGK